MTDTRQEGERVILSGSKDLASRFHFAGFTLPVSPKTVILRGSKERGFWTVAQAYCYFDC